MYIVWILSSKNGERLTISQDEIIQAMRNLGGKDLRARQIRDEFIKIHFDEATYKNILLGPYSQHTSFTYGLKRCYLAGKVTRRLQATNRSPHYTETKQFVYSLA